MRLENDGYLRTFHALKISRLPQFKEMNSEEYQSVICAYIADREERIFYERIAAGQGFLGAKNLRKQLPGKEPMVIAKRRKPICSSINPLIKKMYRNERKLIQYIYKVASDQFRQGLSASFPPYCHKPPSHKVPVCKSRGSLRSQVASSSNS